MAPPVRHLAAGFGPTDVVGGEVIVVQFENHRRRFRQPGAVRAAAARRVQARVVMDHHHAVPGHRQVHFQRGHAQRQRGFEAG